MCLNIRADTKLITAEVGRSLTFLHVTTYCAIKKFPETVYRYDTRVIKVMRRLRARKWVELRVFYCFNNSFLLLFLLVTENRLFKKTKTREQKKKRRIHKKQRRVQFVDLPPKKKN